MYGIKDGRYGLFPSDFVERMSPAAVRREMRVINKVGPGRRSPSPTDARFERSKLQRNSAGDESEDADEGRRDHSHRNGHGRGVGSDTDIEGQSIDIFKNIDSLLMHILKKYLTIKFLKYLSRVNDQDTFRLYNNKKCMLFDSIPLSYHDIDSNF